MRQKASSTLPIVTLKGLADFNNFSCEHFRHCLPSNDRSSYHLTEWFASALSGKNWTGEI